MRKCPGRWDEEDLLALESVLALVRTAPCVLYPSHALSPHLVLGCVPRFISQAVLRGVVLLALVVVSAGMAANAGFVRFEKLSDVRQGDVIVFDPARSVGA